MGRVSENTITKLCAFIDSLPPEARGKCALCNETLVHIVKQAEVATGAGTATVTRALAEKINEGAAMGDVVSGEALTQRVRQVGKNRNLKCHNDRIENYTKKQKPSEPIQTATEANHLATIVISQLSRIRSDDPLREEALDRIIKYIEEIRNN